MHRFANGRRIAIAAAALVAGTLARPSDSDAAVRQCGSVVTSAVIRAVSEPAGKQRALADWTAKATAIEPHPAWRIAANKVLVCTAAAGGGFDCVARARLCTIRQVVPKPTRPGKPERPA